MKFESSQRSQIKETRCLLTSGFLLFISWLSFPASLPVSVKKYARLRSIPLEHFFPAAPATAYVVKGIKIRGTNRQMLTSAELCR